MGVDPVKGTTGSRNDATQPWARSQKPQKPPPKPKERGLLDPDRLTPRWEFQLEP